MSILSKIVGSGVTSVVKEVGSIVDNLNTSSEEKSKLKTELERVFNARLEIQSSDENSLRNEISKRWTSDSTSDVSLAKLIRPITLMLWTVILIGIMVATIFLNISPSQLETLTIWMPLIQTIVITIYAAYFGGRSLEKMVQTNQKTKEIGSTIDYIKTVDTTNILKGTSKRVDDTKIIDNNKKAIDIYTSNGNDMDEFLGN